MGFCVKNLFVTSEGWDCFASSAFGALETVALGIWRLLSLLVFLF